MRSLRNQRYTPSTCFASADASRRNLAYFGPPHGGCSRREVHLYVGPIESDYVVLRCRRDE